MNSFFAGSAILSGVMLTLALLIIVNSSRRPVNPTTRLPKRMIGIWLLIVIGLTLMGVERAFGGPRWIWTLCAFGGLFSWLLLQFTGGGKMGVKNTYYEMSSRRNSALLNDDEKVARVPAKVKGDGRDALICLNIKRGWWMGSMALPRVLINGLAYPVKPGVNELWVEPGAVNVSIYCVDQFRFGDASIEMRVDQDSPRLLYYAQPTTSLGAYGEIGESPVRHPWLVSTTVWLLLLLISLGGAVAPIVRERMGM